MLLLLTMVKNESRIIRRLLDSVEGKVDGVIVCDTGSTDNTVEIVQEYLKTHVGAVYSFPFTNFGASRTKSFQCCQEWVRQNNLDDTNTWALLLDGDMMLNEKIMIDAKPLVAGFTLKQANGSLVYSNVRVLRCSEPWICKGGTHEAWTCPPGKNVVLLESPVLIDHNDGGCKADKYTRDIRLLKEDLEEMPNDCRTLFYLGQTYLCLRDWKNAIDILKRRVEVGGWEEETYMAEVYIGECYEGLEEIDRALFYYLSAWERRPHRTEGAIHAVRMLRKQPKKQFVAKLLLDKVFSQHFGNLFGSGEEREKVNNSDVLFVNKRDLEFDIWEEYSILSYYAGDERACWLRLDELDLKSGLSWNNKNSLLSQMRWYDWVLQPVSRVRFQIPIELLPWTETCWEPFNPSIRRNGDTYLVNLRYANYSSADAIFSNNIYRGYKGQVITRNCLMECVDWNKPLKLEEVKIDPSIKQRDHFIQGVEDCRLIQGSDELEFLGTSQSYSTGTNKIMKVWKDGTWKLKQLALPAGVSEDICQKNWLGFRHGGELLYIYNFSPFTICDESGAVRVRGDDYKDYRGSAGPVPYGDGYLCVIHKVSHDGGGRRYYHRFITLDNTLKVSRISCFVRMTRERIEYWSGITQSINGNYLITYGLKDSEAYIAEMKKEDIDALLFYGSGAGFPDRLKAIKAY